MYGRYPATAHMNISLSLASTRPATLKTPANYAFEFIACEGMPVYLAL